MPSSTDMGMVRPSTPGNSVSVRRSRVVQGTPFAIICSARSMMNGIIRMKVKTSSAMKNGGMISRITYRSIVRMAE